MSDINTKLLVADAVINLLLGVLLLLFPFGIGPALGVPLSESSFYPTLLGAVLKLPPLKQALANEQMKSRFVEAVTRGR